MKQKPPPDLAFTVAFDEADLEGIVFFGNYFRLAHRALEQYLPSIGIPWPEWFANKEWGVPLRHVEAEYLNPLRAGNEFLAEITVHHIGTSSVQFAYVLHSSDGKIFTRLKTSHVFLLRENYEKMSIPDSIKTRLAKQLRKGMPSQDEQ
jgi:YbgC/YbaW family acyl-CoA thioester hydrolase